MNTSVFEEVKRKFIPKDVLPDTYEYAFNAMRAAMEYAHRGGESYLSVSHSEDVRKMARNIYSTAAMDQNDKLTTIDKIVNSSQNWHCVANLFKTHAKLLAQFWAREFGMFQHALGEAMIRLHASHMYGEVGDYPVTVFRSINDNFDPKHDAFISDRVIRKQESLRDELLKIANDGLKLAGETLDAACKLFVKELERIEDQQDKKRRREYDRINKLSAKTRTKK